MNENEQIIGDNSRIDTIQYGKYFCKYCGKELQERAAYCSSCGKPQGNRPVQQSAKPFLQQPNNFTNPYMTAGVYQQPCSFFAVSVSTELISITQQVKVLLP